MVNGENTMGFLSFKPGEFTNPTALIDSKLLAQLLELTKGLLKAHFDRMKLGIGPNEQLIIFLDNECTIGIAIAGLNPKYELVQRK
jgi:hypothetical protein